MASRKFSIDLSQDVADDVRGRVASGDYADESDVIREGLRALADREQSEVAEFEASVKELYAQLKAGTLETVSMEEIRAEIAAERNERR